MSSEFSAEDELRLACRQPCEVCGSLALWLPAFGPTDIVTRLRLMCALAGSDQFDEHVTGRAPDGQPCRPWTSLGADQITHDLVANGRAPDLDDMDSGMEIRCRTCRRHFRQAWSPERGNESWTITADCWVRRDPQL